MPWALQVLLATSQLVQPVAKANPLRLDGKRKEFLRLKSDAEFLAWRAEMVVAHRLATCGAAFKFGDPKVANPDLILTSKGTSEGTSKDIGIEVTSLSPDGVARLLEDLRTELEPACMVAQVRVDHYPVRLRVADYAPLIQWARSVATGGETTNSIRTLTVCDPKNGQPINVTVRVLHRERGPCDRRVTFETTAGELTAALDAVEYAVLEKTRDQSKIKQAKVIPTVLLVDVTRLGAGWIRPPRVWAHSLVKRLDSSFPFIGLGVLITRPEDVAYEIGLAPSPRDDATGAITQLAEALHLGRA